jgi:glycosyltransferase EpsJ
MRKMRFTGAYLEDELFLIEYFSYPTTLASWTRAFLLLSEPSPRPRGAYASLVETFRRSLELKKELEAAFVLNPGRTGSRATLWAGLLIAVGNEFAPVTRFRFSGR